MKRRLLFKRELITHSSREVGISGHPGGKVRKTVCKSPGTFLWEIQQGKVHLLSQDVPSHLAPHSEIILQKGSGSDWDTAGL